MGFCHREQFVVLKAILGLALAYFSWDFILSGRWLARVLFSLCAFEHGMISSSPIVALRAAFACLVLLKG